MSALSLEEHGEWLEAAGFAGCLEKPIQVSTFPDQGATLLRGAEGDGSTGSTLLAPL